MKKNSVLLLVILLSIFSSSYLTAQERKVEKRVKVIVSDGTGTDVMTDTSFTDIREVDSLRLKDGSTLYLNSDESGEKGSVRKKIFITSSAGREDKSGSREITVTATDSSGSDGFPEKHIVREIVINDGAGHGEKKSENYVYVSRDRKNSLNDSDRVDVWSSDNNDIDMHSDRTKYVIAKDGIVVTIEGDDEAKVQEIRKSIEEKLNIKTDK